MSAEDKKVEVLSDKKSLTSPDFMGRFSVQEITLITAWLYAKSPQTQRLYKRIVFDFFSYFNELNVSNTELGHGLIYMKSVSHLKKSSQNLTRDVLCSLFSFCVKSGYLSSSPFISLERFKAPDPFGSKVLDEKEVIQIIDNEKSDRNRLIIKLLYESGIRVSELVKIRYSDLSKRPDGTALLMVVGKGAKIRGVVIRQKLVSEIEQYLEKNKKESQQSEYLFFSQKKIGHTLTSTQVYRIIRKAALRSGIEKKVSPHWFRHSSATHALERGAPIHVVKATLGHENLATTGKYLDRRPSKSNSDFLPEI